MCIEKSGTTRRARNEKIEKGKGEKNERKIENVLFFRGGHKQKGWRGAMQSSAYARKGEGRGKKKL